jgi:hypothetical protein
MSRSVLLCLGFLLAGRFGTSQFPQGRGRRGKRKNIIRRFRRGGQYLIGMPDPLGCEFSLWPAINPTV